ncbi:hypothetical protein [Pinibacter soli]|uniref:Outer membrane protein beta-barrel domain-containing protein n=1 Tax=Pinibacter soli TaxID=3044211 RepID=A0ABT6RA26_9BACT|nr:hypothetical protein [Pinibacter soli]MDI3319421.1 hypothetical protein [Pinibacter soli]
MKIKLSFLFVAGLLFILKANAQLEAIHLSTKNFKAWGFGAFFNGSVPVSDADYVTAELGLSVFSSNQNNIGLAPLVAGYRYTFNRTGVGLYAEPNVGYSFGGSDIQVNTGDGNYADQKVAGAAAGITVGYLFPISEGALPIQFNLGVRYEHIFAPVGIHMVSLRIAHAFCFGRRD